MRSVAFWLSLIVIFIIPWENSITVAGLGTLVRVAGFFVAAFWCLTVLATGQVRKPHPFHVVMLLFVVWNVASAFWSLGLPETIERIVTYLQLFILVWILWDLYATPQALKAGLQAYVLGAYVSIGSIVASYLADQASGSPSLSRYTGAGLNANTLAMILALGIPVAWHLALSAGGGKRRALLRLANLAYIPAALFAILLTASRTGLLVAVLACLFVLATFPWLRRFPRVLLSVALIGALFALYPHVPQTSFDRLSTVGTSIAAGDLGGRVAIWREGLAAFVERPLLGVGSGAFPVAVESGKVAHNTFLSVLVELGVIGFAIFVVMLALALYQAGRQPTKWDSRLWLTLLLLWAIGVSTLTWEDRKPTWMFLSLVIAGAALSRQPEEPARRSESPVGAMDLPSLTVARRATPARTSSQIKGAKL